LLLYNFIFVIFILSLFSSQNDYFIFNVAQQPCAHIYSIVDYRYLTAANTALYDGPVIFSLFRRSTDFRYVRGFYAMR